MIIFLLINYSLYTFETIIIIKLIDMYIYFIFYSKKKQQTVPMYVFRSYVFLYIIIKIINEYKLSFLLITLP